MTFGSGNPVVRIAVVALFAASLGWFGYTMWRMTSGAQPIASATPAPRPAPRTAAAREGPQAGSLITLEKRLDPTLRLDLLKATEETEYKGSGRNIFHASAPPPEPLPQPEDSPIVEEQQPQILEPVQPKIDLKFYGYASRPGEPKKIFLAQGENIFIGGEGDIVNRRYRIVRIGPTSVEIEDVLNNNKQSIPLTS